MPVEIVNRFHFNPTVASGIAHGSDIPALSVDAESFLAVPQPNTLPTFAGGSLEFGTFENPIVVEDQQVDGQLRIREGGHYVFRRCVILGSFGAGGSGYTVRMNESGGASLRLEQCLVICRAGAGGSTSKTKNVVTWGDTSIHLKGCVLRGGLDSIYHGPSNSPGLIPTGDAVIPFARFLVEDTWVGDGERIASGHADLTQLNINSSGLSAAHMLIRRSRYMAFSIPEGSDTLTTRITDPATATMASTSFISTHISTTGGQKSHFAIRDCWLEGGNYITQANSVDVAPTELTGNLYGQRRNFGSRTGFWSKIENCRYGFTGEVVEPVSQGGTQQVQEGDPIPGSTEV